MTATRAPELACGELTLILDQIWDVTALDVLGLCRVGGLTPEESNLATSDFDEARARLSFQFALKLQLWTLIPRVAVWPRPS